MFCQDGYEGASMASIAAQAGVSKGTLYNYFDSKEALFVSYVEESCATRLAHVFDGVGLDGDISDTLHLLAQRGMMLMLAPEGIEMYRLVISIAPKFPNLAATFYTAGAARALGYMRVFLERAHAEGKLNVPDAAFAAEQFFALCQTKVVLRRRLNLSGEDPGTLEKIVEGAVSMFLHSYGTKP